MNMYNYLGPYNSQMTPIVLDDSSDIPEYLHQSAHQPQAQPQDQGSTPDESNKTPISHTFISVAVKVINPAKKSDIKLFMLRNVDKDHIRTLDDLKGIICEQFGEDIVSQDLQFDCGYYRNNKKICCMVTPKIKGKSMPLSAIMHTVSLHRHIMAYCQFTQSDNGILSVYTATDL